MLTKLLASIFFGCLFTLTNHSYSQAREVFVPGVYAVVRPSDHVNIKKMLSLNYISGVTFITAWQRIQPEPDKYKWEELDAALKVAAAENKKVNIVVLAGKYTPAWVYAGGAKKIKFRRSLNEAQMEGGKDTLVEMPMAWDPEFKKSWNIFLKKLAERYDNNPNVGYVMITGANISALTVGMTIRDGGTKRDTMESLRESGLSNSVWVSSWKEMIDFYFSTFKNKPLCLGVAPFFDQAEPVEELVDYGISRYGKSFLVLGDFLNGKWFARPTIGKPVKAMINLVDKSSIDGTSGFQMLWWSSYDNGKVNGDLTDALENGLDLNISWMEVWHQDILTGDSENPTWKKDLVRASNVLSKRGQ